MNGVNRILDLVDEIEAYEADGWSHTAWSYDCWQDSHSK